MENFEIAKKVKSVNEDINKKLSFDSNGNLLVNGNPVQSGGGTSNPNGNIDADFSVNNMTVKGNIMPSANGTQDIGAPDNRFKTIYVDEAKLSTNTLYIGDTPVLGTSQDTIVIKGDIDQSVTMKTSGVGTTKVISGSGVELSTSGMNANVTVQATGSGSNANIGATNQVNLTAPSVNLNGNTSVDSLTVRGNLIVNGETTTVNSATVQVVDNIMELNKNEVGYGVTAGRAGIKIDRGDADAQLLVFDETDDKFKVGIDSSLKSIATEDYVDNKTPTKTSQLTNDSGFLTSIPNNYAKINDNGTTGDVAETYSIDKIISLLSNKQNKLYLQNTQPSNPMINDIWINNTSSPYIMNVYNGSSFIQVGGSSSGIGITDWTSNTNYTINTSFVLYNNLLYRCTVTHTSGTSFDSTKWQYIGSTDAKSINGIIVDDSNRSNGRGLFYNQSTNKLEYSDVNITGIIGSTTITPISNTSITAGSEVTFNHPSSVNLIPVIEEQIFGSSVTDTHVDFSDSTKYTLQDSSKLLVNNKVQMKNATYCVNSYKFEETSGTNCVDSKGLSNGTYNGTTSVNGSIGNARSFNGTSDYIQFANTVIPVGKKTIKFKIKIDTIPTKLMVIYDNTNVDQAHAGNLMLIGTNGKLSFMNSKGTNGAWNFSCSSINSICDGIYHTIMCTWDGTTTNNSVKMYIDDLINPVSTTTALASEIVSSYNLRIGCSVLGTSIATYFKGILDEFEIYNDIINPSTLPTYVGTTGLTDYSLTTIDTITSLTIPNTIPINTSIKCLFSVDNYTNYLYYDGTSIKKFTGDLTVDWGSTYSTISQIQTLFTNLSVTALNTMLSSLGITAVNLDLVFQLNTSDTSVTPSISPITMVYVTKSHTEFASIGSYDETNVKFGVKRVNSSTLAVKNLTTKNRIINVNLVTSS